MARLVLLMFVDMSTANPTAFVNHVNTLKKHVEKQPNFQIQMIQVVGAVGTIDEVSKNLSHVKFIDMLKTKLVYWSYSNM